MNDELPAWDHDPRLTASIDARLQELTLMHTSGDNRWVRTVLALSEDLVANNEVPEMLSAVCRFVTNLAVGCHDQEVAVARFSADLQQLRAIAIKEATS